MKVTKKLLAILIVGVMALGILTGCGNSNAINTAMIAKAWTSMIAYTPNAVPVIEDTEITEALKTYLRSKGGVLDANDILPNEEKTVILEVLKSKGVELKNENGSVKYVAIGATPTDGADAMDQAAGLNDDHKVIQGNNSTPGRIRKVFKIGTATGKLKFNFGTVNARFAILILDTVPEALFCCKAF